MLTAAAALLNYAAGRIGKTVDFSRAHALSRTATNEQMQEFLAGLTREDVLIVHNSNPAYSFNGAEEHLRRAGTLVYLGTMPDETAELAEWVLPIDSPLESWGDYEPHDGNPRADPADDPAIARQPAGGRCLSLAGCRGGQAACSDWTAAQPIARFEDWLRARWEELLQVEGHGRRSGRTLCARAACWSRARVSFRSNCVR